MPTKIPFCDVTLNLTAGCSKCAPGCLDCWAERVAKRLKGAGIKGYDKVVDSNGWTGHIELCPWLLDKPLHLRRPRRIFVASLSDLFHPDVPFEFIDKVYVKISDYKRHKFLIFTKRIERMLEYHIRRPRIINIDGVERMSLIDWPIPNLISILSLSTQAEADDKIPLLLKIPAIVRGLSIEPLLGNIKEIQLTSLRDGQHIEWVVIGCESLTAGKAGRFQDGFIAAARNIVRQCQAADVPVYIKQISIKGKANRKISDWPKDLQIQDYPK